MQCLYKKSVRKYKVPILETDKYLHHYRSYKIKKDANSDNSEQISKEEEEKITAELKKLGYI